MARSTASCVTPMPAGSRAESKARARTRDARRTVVHVQGRGTVMVIMMYIHHIRRLPEKSASNSGIVLRLRAGPFSFEVRSCRDNPGRPGSDRPDALDVPVCTVG